MLSMLCISSPVSGQFVEFDKLKSDINTGVHQGSIILPLLFIIYIVNDMVSVSKLFKFIIYAEDTTLSSTLSEWLKVNNLSLNVKKN